MATPCSIRWSNAGTSAGTTSHTNDHFWSTVSRKKQGGGAEPYPRHCWWTDTSIHRMTTQCYLVSVQCNISLRLLTFNKSLFTWWKSIPSNDMMHGRVWFNAKMFGHPIPIMNSEGMPIQVLKQGIGWNTGLGVVKRLVQGCCRCKIRSW